MGLYQGFIMKIKIFFSYSTKNRAFLDNMLQSFGHDFAIVDQYALESGKELWPEIRKSIEEATHFVFLMSESALSSEWCNEELGFVRDLFDNEEISILCYRIDPNVNIEELGRKRWLKHYVSNVICKPMMLARSLKRQIRHDIWKHFPEMEKKYQLFIGRDSEMGKLTHDFYENVFVPKKAMILSGIPHIGRRRILREFIQRVVTANPQACEIINIKLKDNDDLFDFVLQLNDIIEKFDYDGLLDMLCNNKEQCLKCAVLLLNELHQNNEYVVIEDDNCVVRGNGRVTSWFIDLVKNKDLSSHLHLYVASRYTPISSVSNNFPEILTFSVSALDRKRMHTLFNAYLKICDVSLMPKDVDAFLDVISVYPEHAFFAVDNIKKSLVPIALKNTRERVEFFDGNFIDIISSIRQNDSVNRVLLTLSLFEFISYDTLSEIMGRDCVEDIEALYHYSILEFFGSNGQYMCLSHAFGDYLRRMKLRLSKEELQNIKRQTQVILQNMNEHLPDISFRLYATKELIRENNPKLDEKYLIPSLVLKVVTEEYYDRNDSNVIDLCYRLLDSFNQKQYDDIMRSIHYWLCCALCRKKDARFLQEIKYFDEESYSRYFLYGFYWRHKHDYKKAEEFYEEALRRRYDSEDTSYISKAQHEMVIVQTHLGHYSQALALAEDSYNHAKNNTYHIESYFRCLVRTNLPKRNILKQLIDEMKNSQDVHKDVIGATMEAEYEFYINRNIRKSFDMILKILEKTNDSYQNYPLRSLHEMCKSIDNLNYYKKIISDYSLTENHFFDEED